MLNFFKKLFGDDNDKVIKQIQPLVTKINALESDLRTLDDAGLRAKSDELRSDFREMTSEALADLEREFEGQSKIDPLIRRKYQLERRKIEDTALNELLPEAFALVREAARRTIGLRHYDVQMIGGIVLHQGRIAEMKTGEGKTLVATLPLYLNAIAGQGAHLITVNDYLAKVGAGWMGPIYHLLGMSVGLISHDYSALFDPTYVDPNSNPEDRRLIHWRPCTRRQAYEADITYGTNNEFGFDYLRDNMAFEINLVVQRELYYAIVDEVDNILIDEARTPLIISGPSRESSDEYRRFAQLVRNLKPSKYTPDQVKKQMIADPEGDFLIEPRAKTVHITDQGVARVERLLRIPNDESLYDPKYYQMTHFLENALRAEFIYQRDRDYIVEADGEVVIVDEFTGRKMPGRRWSDGLHQAVEAKEGVQTRQENVTMATITFQNYFRMYQKLCGMTGTAYTEREEFGKIYNLEVTIIPTNRPMVRKDLTDQIYRTEHAKFEAVVGEIQDMREQGRPVLVGTTSVETSERLSDLLDRNGIAHHVLNAKHHEREAFVVAQAGRPGNVTIATNMAGRGTDILLGGNPDGLVEDILKERRISFEEATPEQRQEAWQEAKRRCEADGEKVRQSGGLHIIGTERHEARRIDNQLRGRAGRQGDPGSSRFFLSLEDDLMRRFGPMDAVKNAMSRLGVDENVPIEARLINRSIEGAQTRVEGYNFDIRKHTVQFDDVMNKQRAVVYADRRSILEGQEMRERVLEMIGAEVGRMVAEYLPENHEDWDVDELLRNLRQMTHPAQLGLVAEELEQLSRPEVEHRVMDAVESAYEAREDAIGEEAMRYVERRLLLGIIDRQWIDYLTGMEDLRQEIGLQAIAQRDPLVEYQRNAFGMFDELKVNIQRDVVYQIIPVSFQYEQQLRQIEAEQRQRLMMAQRAGGSTMEDMRAPRTVRKNMPKVGRNDPCPCGSGKKFKHCHEGRELELETLLASGVVSTPPSGSVATQIATGQTSGAAERGRGRAVPNDTTPNRPLASVQRGKNQAQRKK